MERAIRVLGLERVRPGPIPVGKKTPPVAVAAPRGRAKRTRRLTATKRGLSAMERQLSRVTTIQTEALKKAKRRGKAPLFTYDLEVRFRGKDGKLKTELITRTGVPRVQDLRRRVNKKTGRKETLHQAMKRKVRQQVNEAARGVVATHFKKGDSNFADNVEKYGYKRARSMLRELKSEQQVTFRMTFNREV